MQIARDIAGFTMGEADELRKVMGKKQKDKIPIYREKFVDGCVEHNGIEREAGRATSSRSSNRSRATASTSRTRPRTAGSRTRPRISKRTTRCSIFAALMSSVRDKTDKLVEYIDEAKKIGIAVLPPDVNESLVDFAVVGGADPLRPRRGQRRRRRRGRARSSRRANATASSSISSISPSASMRKQANRKVFEALIKCGALDTLPGNRAQKLDALDGALDVAARAARDRELGPESRSSAMLEDARAGVRAAVAAGAGAVDVLERWRGRRRRSASSSPGHPLADVADALARTRRDRRQRSARASKTTRRSRIAGLSRACAAR